MSGSEYLVGLACFCIIFGSAFAGSALLLRLLPEVRGAERWVAFGVLATALLIAVHLLPGALGILTRWTVAATALLAVLGAWLVARRAGAGSQEPARTGSRSEPGPHDLLLRAAAAGGVAAYVLAALFEMRVELAEPATTVDTTTFHLPQVAAWIRTESLWGIHQFIPLQAHANYPQNGDVIHLATVLPWRNDAFARPIGWAYIGLAALAVYALTQRIAAGRQIAALTAVAFASVPALILSTTGGTLTDPILAGLFGAGLVFLARHAATGARTDLLLAGLGLGLAFGTKWYGVSSVIATITLWSAIRLVTEGGQRGTVVRDAAALTGVIGASGGFWLLRNWVASGNPVFPVKVDLLGVTVFDAPTDTVRESLGWSISDYIGEPDVLTGPIADALWSRWSLPGALFLAAVAAGAVILAMRRAEIRLWPSFLVCLAPVLLAVYLITPYTALGFEGDPFGAVFNARYGLPALIAAAPLLAWVAVDRPRLALTFGAVLLVATALGIREGFAPGSAESAALAMTGLAAACLAFLAGQSRRPSLPHLSARSATALVALVMAGAAVIGYERQRAFNDDRYTQDSALAWIAENAPEGHRVGLEGEWTVTAAAPVLPAFGPRFENAVSYVGTLEPGFLTPHRSARAWREDVAAERYDLLLIGRLKPGRARRVREWSRALGFETVVRSPSFLLMGRPQPR